MQHIGRLVGGIAGSSGFWLALVLGLIPAANAAAAVRVVMLPIAVNSNLEETEYLSQGLADMLSARIEQSGEIVIVRSGEASSDRAAAVEAGQ